MNTLRCDRCVVHETYSTPTHIWSVHISHLSESTFQMDFITSCSYNLTTRHTRLSRSCSCSCSQLFMKKKMYRCSQNTHPKYVAIRPRYKGWHRNRTNCLRKIHSWITELYLRMCVCVWVDVSVYLYNIYTNSLTRQQYAHVFEIDLTMIAKFVIEWLCTIWSVLVVNNREAGIIKRKNHVFSSKTSKDFITLGWFEKNMSCTFIIFFFRCCSHFAHSYTYIHISHS